ncbi:hypothetical protein B0F90DRAFT_680039 [Multifurca ochricompacta]|uniref:Uncharacterized protein n=1 Tax=Multifurca ochricompacta TaxID=376703 RepID=A0AAD4M3S1_9AGAM|nr:hypothetical protein B0F90DRAFT_680039 [Multifurca ochricompacta]
MKERRARGFMLSARAILTTVFIAATNSLARTTLLKHEEGQPARQIDFSHFGETRSGQTVQYRQVQSKIYEIHNRIQRPRTRPTTAPDISQSARGPGGKRNMST